jgi:hypothetical protein
MMSDEQHFAWLRQKLAEYNAEQQKAEEVLARVRPLTEHILALIQAFDTEQGQEVGTNQPAPQSQPSSNDGMGSHPIIDSPRTSRMPDRRPEYRDMSTVAACMRVLESQLRAWHVDELVGTIYNVYSKKDKGFDAAKRVVSSELSRAANVRHLLQKLGGHRFASNNFRLQHDNGLPTASSPLLPSHEAAESEEVLPANDDGLHEREERLDGGGIF